MKYYRFILVIAAVSISALVVIFSARAFPRTIHVIIERTVNSGYAVYYADYYPDRDYGRLIYVSTNLTDIGIEASGYANFVSSPVQIVMPQNLNLTFSFDKSVTFAFY